MDIKYKIIRLSKGWELVIIVFNRLYVFFMFISQVVFTFYYFYSVFIKHSPFSFILLIN